MRTLWRSRTVGLAMLLLLSVSSGGVGAADEADGVEQRLAAVTAERDGLLAEQEAAASRYERCAGAETALDAILADPDAYGSEDEVLDLLDTYAVPGSVYGDEAFGETTWRSGWRQTLFGGGIDATIRTWKEWFSDDGSAGGSLWTWSGNAVNGEPFELHGIVLFTCNEDGLRDWTYVYYPYEHDVVEAAFYSGN